MTKPIHVRVLASNHLATAIMNSAMLQLHEDRAITRLCVLPAWGKNEFTLSTIYPARGAKPFVLRVLREFAALCED